MLARVLAACALLVSCATERRPPLAALEPAHDVAIVDVALFDAVDGQRREHMDVVIRGGRIAAIAPAGAAESGLHVVNGRGKTLLPGFVDAHVHIGSNGAAAWQKGIATEPERNLEGWLYAGITTVFDMGGDVDELAALKEKTRRGELAGPRILHAHSPIGFKGGHPIPIGAELLGLPEWIGALVLPQASDEESARELVDTVLAQSIDFVKITCDELPEGTPQMPEAVLRAAVATAKAGGRPVAVHVGSEANALAAVRAGANVLAHGVFRGPLSDEGARELGAARVPVVFTLAGVHGVASIGEGKFVGHPLDDEISSAALLAGVRGEAARTHAKSKPVFWRFVELAGCSGSESCAVDVARALDADHLVHASVGRVGKTYVVSASLMQVSGATIEKRAQQEATSDETLLSAMRAVATELGQ